MEPGGERHDRVAQIGRGKFLQHAVRKKCVCKNDIHFVRESGKHRIAFIVNAAGPHNRSPLFFGGIKELPRSMKHDSVDVIAETVVDRKRIVASAPRELALIDAVRRNQDGQTVDFRLLLQSFHGGRLAQNIESGVAVDERQHVRADRKNDFRFPARGFDNDERFAAYLFLRNHDEVLMRKTRRKIPPRKLS